MRYAHKAQKRYAEKGGLAEFLLSFWSCFREKKPRGGITFKRLVRCVSTIIQSLPDCFTKNPAILVTIRGAIRCESLLTGVMLKTMGSNIPSYQQGLSTVCGREAALYLALSRAMMLTEPGRGNQQGEKRPTQPSLVELYQRKLAVVSGYVKCVKPMGGMS